MHLLLAGLDGSKRESLVLSTSLDLARRLGARIVLCRAVGVPHEVPPEAYSVSPSSLVDVLHAEATRYLDEIEQGCPPELIAGRVVHIGVPWQSICAVADEQNVDLIVIGSHGYSGLDKILGTTAGKIVNHATKSVLVVRTPISD